MLQVAKLTRMATRRSGLIRQGRLEAVEPVSDAYFALDRDWRFTYVSAETERVLSRSRQELLGHSIWEVFPELLGTAFECEYRAALERGVNTRFTEFSPTRGRWIEVRAFPSTQGLSVYSRDITVERDVEDALHESRRRLELALDAGALGFWEWQAKDRKVLWSPQMQRICGLTANHFEAADLCAQLLHPEDRRTVLDQLHCGIDEQAATVHVQHRIIRPTGEIRWLQSHGHFFYTADNRISRLVGISQDVTDQVRAEAQLAASEERYRSLVQATAAIVWTTNAAGEFNTDQPAWTAFTGQTWEQLRGTGWLEIVHPEDRARVRKAWNEAVTTHELYEIEARLRRRDGQYSWMLVRAVPILDEHQAVKEWIGVHLDISERHAVVDALREREEEFRTLANSIPQLAWMSDSSGLPYWYNQRYYDYTGSTLDEVRGWGWLQLMEREHAQRLSARVLQAIATGKSWENTHPLRGKNGELRWFLSRGLPVRDKDGKIVRWLGTATDITAQRENAARLDEALSDAQAARSEAEEANHVKSMFLARMSHDLRTPLNAIGGYADLVELGIQGPVTERQVESMHRIKRAKEFLLTLINDILSFARLESGQVRLRIADVPVSETLEGLGALIETETIDHGLQFSYEPGSREIQVRADRERLIQVLLNLLTNAVKFTEPGGTVLLR
jgi:PAS domain S-box-containing protein